MLKGCQATAYKKGRNLCILSYYFFLQTDIGEIKKGAYENIVSTFFQFGVARGAQPQNIRYSECICNQLISLSAISMPACSCGEISKNVSQIVSQLQGILRILRLIHTGWRR